MKDEDYAFETQRQKRIDQGEVKMTEQVKTERPQRTPEQQATHDKEMKERADLLFQMPIVEVHARAAFCLADMVRAVAEGRLKPEDITPTPEELIVITYGAVSRKMLDRRLKEILGGLQ